MGYNTGCIDRIYTGLGVTCVQNAVIGREKEWSVLLKSQEKKKVVIVGGGPAGLECARVARMRGHTVILFEKGDELGGQTLIARYAPSRQDFDGACRYAAQQCEKLRVEIRLSTPATVESILAESPDAVVLATGAKAFQPPIPGLEDFGYSAWEVLQGEDVSGDRILVLDEQYGYHAPSVAEYLLDRGKEVDIITSEPSIVGLLGDTTRPPVLQRLFTKGVQVRGFLRALYLEGSEVIAENVWSHAEESVGDYDAVVYAYGGQAVDEMRERLLESVSTVEMVGDCFAPRSLQHAIYEGHKFGREL
jgi:thioredoxin reductase